MDDMEKMGNVFFNQFLSHYYLLLNPVKQPLFYVLWHICNKWHLNSYIPGYIELMEETEMAVFIVTA